MTELADREMAEPNGADQSHEPGPRAKVNAEFRRTTAERMFQARMLRGLPQQEAARDLGYRNSTQLSLVEQGIRTPPHAVLAQAADLYGVSLDFLMGRVDSPELNELLAGRNAALRAAADIIQGAAEQLTQQVQGHLLCGTRSAVVARDLAIRAATTTQALMRFRQLNADCFDDLRGGANLLHAVRELEAATAAAQATFNAQRAQLPSERRHRV
jgi:transcriptional regulator with XRE-family HTH domain